MKEKIETKRLIIITQSLNEIKKLYENELDQEDKKAYLDMIHLLEDYPDSEAWCADWKIALKDGTPIGGICFKGFPDQNKEVEIGYEIWKEYRKHGFGKESVQGLINWAFSHGVEKVIAQTDENNVISQTLLLHLGFKPCGNKEEGPAFALVNEK